MTVIPTANSVGAGVRITLPAGEDLYLGQGFLIASTNNDAVQGTGSHDIDIHGEIYGSFDGLDMTGDNSDIDIAATGSVTGGSQGILSRGDGLTFSNSGRIAGGSNAVDHLGDDVTFQNFGTIVSSNFHGIEFGSADGAVINYGSIISNSGTAEAVDVFQSTDNGAAPTLINFGTIMSTFEFSVSMDSGDDNYAENHGVMGGLETGNANDTFINTGTVSGNVVLLNGNDTYDGRGGSVTGEVLGGDGDDTYMVDDASSILVEDFDDGTDTVLVTSSYALRSNFENLSLIGSADATGVGNSADNEMFGNTGSNRLGGSTGNDTITALAGNDSLYGGGGSDVLNGGEGDDWMSSGAANDTILGEDGNDVLMGQRGSDLLNGGDGSDVLIGGSGNDTLAGGREDDTLIGGEGSDQLNGASGIDTFVWNTVSESLNSSARDKIIGYQTGVDVMDFREVMKDGFDINIGTGFTAGGTASVRTFEAGADTRVFVDFDGNGTNDMRVDIIGVLGVTEVDFLL